MNSALRHIRRIVTNFSSRADQPFFTKDYFENYILHHGWQIGDFSYGKPAVIGGMVAKLHIGKYCSISENCSIILADHNSSHVSTFPFLNVGLSGVISPQPFPDLHATSKGDVHIGSDVWIGRNTVILSGTNIGDGAVIGAGSIVTKDVPPYGIVVGNPARLVRYRFDQDVILKLLQIKWWDWDPNFVFENSKDLRSNTQDFVKKYL